jgi:hypothetical protein
MEQTMTPDEALAFLARGCCSEQRMKENPCATCTQTKEAVEALRLTISGRGVFANLARAERDNAVKTLRTVTRQRERLLKAARKLEAPRFGFEVVEQLIAVCAAIEEAKGRHDKAVKAAVSAAVKRAKAAKAVKP